MTRHLLTAGLLLAGLSVAQAQTVTPGIGGLTVTGQSGAGVYFPYSGGAVVGAPGTGTYNNGVYSSGYYTSPYSNGSVIQRSYYFPNDGYSSPSNSYYSPSVSSYYSPSSSYYHPSSSYYYGSQRSTPVYSGRGRGRWR